MQNALLLSALAMGVAGGPHCVVMCGAACTGLSQAHAKPNVGIVLYHLGRLCGYALLGAIASYGIRSIAWLSDYSAVLHPLWTFSHVLIFFWGAILIIYAKQPLWIDNTGKRVWRRIKQLSAIKGGHFYIGGLWAFMPCGLLYSALVIAAFNANPAGGAMTMAAFAIGSSVSLFFAPWIWLNLKTKLVEPYGMRLAGLMLTSASAWAICMQLTHDSKIWCAV
jgi:uncharacterized protein